MKKKVIKILKKFGYDLHPIDKLINLDTYRRLYSEESLENKRFYNIGAGKFYHPYWTNIDYYSDWYKKNSVTSLSGIHHDLMSLEKFPIENNSAEVVYSSHTVEHITNEAALVMFEESYRILKTNGILRITTPNIDLEYRAFKENDRDFFYWIKQYSHPKEIRRVKIRKPMNEFSTAQIFLYHFAANISKLPIEGIEKRISDEEIIEIFREKRFEEAMNYFTSKCSIEIQSKNPGNHINWWNPNKLIKMLKSVGFTNVYQSGFGQSYSPILRNIQIFDNTHPKISMYIEARK